jgi:hypothetical protein
MADELPGAAHRAGARGPAPENMGIESRHDLASGGRTAGLNPNPAHGGNQPLHGTGPSLVPNGMPTLEGAQRHAMRIGQIQRAVQSGQMHPTHGAAEIAKSQAYIDRHAAMKRTAAVKASRPKGMPNFGSLADDGDGGPEQSSLLSSGGGSDVPGGSAMGTTRSPFNQGNQSGGQGTSFRPGGRRGLGY